MSAVLTRSIIFIGVGLCGCRQVKKLMEKGYEGFLLNTSETDFQMIGDVPELRKYKVPDASGVDKNRELALELFGERLDEISTYILKANSSFQHYVFVFSTGGGSGSGGAPALAQHFGTMFEEEGKGKTVSIIATNPDEKDGYEALENAKACMKYIETQCDAIRSKIYLDNSQMDKFAINTQLADLVDGLMNLSTVDEEEDTEALERQGMKQADDEEALALWRTDGCVNMSIINPDSKEDKKEVVEQVVFMPQYSKRPSKMAVSMAKGVKLDVAMIREELINAMGESGTDIKAGHNDSGVSYAYTFGLKTPKSIMDRINGMMTNIKNRASSVEEEEEISFDDDDKDENPFTIKKKEKTSNGSPFAKKMGSPFGKAKLSSKR